MASVNGELSVSALGDFNAPCGLGRGVQVAGRVPSERPAR
jgi:hypothetical protein